MADGPMVCGWRCATPCPAAPTCSSWLPTPYDLSTVTVPAAGRFGGRRGTARSTLILHAEHARALVGAEPECHRRTQTSLLHDIELLRCKLVGVAVGPR